MAEIRPIFKEPSNQADFENQGSSLLHEFLNEETVGNLREYYDALDNDHIPWYGFHYSMDNESPEFFRGVLETIRNAAADAVSKHFDRCKIATGSFVVKECNPKSVVPAHQDWTFVDETRFNSVTVWIPLQPVHMKNGAVGVLHGSHKWFDHIRPSPAPQFRPPFGDHMFTIFPYLDLFEMDAGQALVFDNRTIHASPPNVTDEPRLAIAFVIVQEEADLVHHFLLPGEDDPLKIERFAVDDEFFCRFGNTSLSKLYDEGKKPEGLESLGIFGFHCPALTEKELKKLIKSDGNKKNWPLMLHLAKVFNFSVDGKKKAEDNDAATPAESKPVTEPAEAVDNPEHPFKHHAHNVGEFYTEQYDAFRKVYGDVCQAFRTHDVNKLLDYQLTAMNLKEGESCFDAGCGVGGPALYFAEHAGVNVTGYTMSEKEASEASERAFKKGLQNKVTFSRNDYHMVDSHFPKNHFDVVYFLESFGHSPDKRRIIDASFNILKPGGRLYIKDLFLKEPAIPEHEEGIRTEADKINKAYHYQIADLYEVLQLIRRAGFILQSLKTIDLDLEDFENLTISNEFQELTGIGKIENWDEYLFPVDFFEITCMKPVLDLGKGASRYFLQNLYHMKVLGTAKEDL